MVPPLGAAAGHLDRPRKMDIKICGLTNLADARAALEAGADFLGFVLYPESPRGIAARTLRRIMDRLPGTPRAIGVFVNEAREEVLRVAADCGLYAVQLHGDETARDFAQMLLRIWRAVRLGRGAPRPAPEDWPAERYVVDAAVRGAYGGTGRPADWRRAAVLARAHPVMLAGGLTPANVADAIRQVRPMGVDVASGVEKSPGKKDLRKLKAFIRAARDARETGGAHLPRGARGYP